MAARVQCAMRPILIVALALALGLGASPAQAVVTANCGDVVSTFGADCGLDELLAGAEFAIDANRFGNWDAQLGAIGVPFSASSIRVDPIDDPSNPGFTLVDTADAWRFSNGAFSFNDLSFDLTIDAPSMDGVVDRSLTVLFGSVSGIDLDEENQENPSFVELDDRIMQTGGAVDVANALIRCSADDTPECAFTTQSVNQDFAMSFPGVSVALGLRFLSVPGGLAEVESVEYRFAVPEPSSATLIGLGLAGVGYSSRFRQRTRARRSGS